MKSKEQATSKTTNGSKAASLIISMLFVFVGIISVKAQSSGSCFSRTGTISANIQVSYADKIDEPVVFDAGNSTGVGEFFKEPIEWDFGDGFTAKMCRATHVYRNPGTYTVTLRVKDNSGNLSTTTSSVTIADIPAASGNNILTVITNGSGNGVTTFNTIQAAVNKAAAINGSGTVEIIIPAGASFAENVELKVPQGNNYITLKSSALNNLSRGIRVNRTALSGFPTIKSPLNNENLPAVRTELKNSSGGNCTPSQTCLPAHHYRFQGIQFMVDSGTLPNGLYEVIVQIGRDDIEQNESSEQAHHFIIDRCLIYREDYSASNPNPQNVKQGLETHGTRLAVLDSYISGINAPGVESHAMATHNSTGVWSVINNHLESGGIAFINGGSFPLIPDARVEDVEFRRNRFHKPLEKKNLPEAYRWSAKNNFETKNGKYWVIDENLFDGGWIGSDQKTLINFNALASDTGAQATVQDIQFTHNVIKQGPGGFLIGRVPGPYTNAPLPARLLIYNNLMTDLGGADYGTPSWCQADCAPVAEGQGFIISTVYADTIMRHNTMLVRKDIIEAEGSVNQAMLFKDNIANHGDIVIDGELGYGIKGGGTNRGCQTIDPSLPGCAPMTPTGSPFYFAGSFFDKNVIAGVPFNSSYPSNPNYPGNNTPYPYQSTNYYFATSTPNNPTGNANINNHFVNRIAGNYRISGGTPGKNGASDGIDVGANIDKTELVTANAVSGNWGSGVVNQTPYPGPNPPVIPTTIEAENFDKGGQGIAYNENNGNTGSGAYRSNPVEAVDIQARSTAGNGYEVFEASAGEWLKYTVNVPFIRKYDIGIRYASAFDNGKIRIEDCGSNPNNNNCTDITGLLTTAKTNADGTWNNFRVVTKRGVQLSAGNHTLRLVMVTNSPDSCGCVVADFDAILFKPTLFDFDDDGRADVSSFRPSDGNWYLQRSALGFTAATFGASTDIITPADFDGDGKTDIAVFRPSNGYWYRLNSSNGTAVSLLYGASGDVPVQADYDGDGKADIAVFRPSTGTWYYIKSSDGNALGGQFGANGDRPAVGDYDADGKADLAVFRPSNGAWYILNGSSGNMTSLTFGASADKITPADFDGDGKTDVAVFRPSDGTWYLQRSLLGFAGIPFGAGSDVPVPADYDGDGKVDIAVFRPSTGIWYLLRSTEGLTSQTFGQSGDVPIASTYIR